MKRQLPSLFAVLLLSAMMGAVAHAREGDTFDPLGFPGDGRVVTEDVKHYTKQTDKLSQTKTSATPLADSANILLRVQFYATADPAQARDVKTRAEAAFSDSVYMTFETPYYKLRTGSFNQYDRAEARALRLQRMGYESAWVVRVRSTTSPDNDE